MCFVTIKGFGRFYFFQTTLKYHFVALYPFFFYRGLGITILHTKSFVFYPLQLIRSSSYKRKWRAEQSNGGLISRFSRRRCSQGTRSRTLRHRTAPAPAPAPCSHLGAATRWRWRSPTPRRTPASPSCTCARTASPRRHLRGRDEDDGHRQQRDGRPPDGNGH